MGGPRICPWPQLFLKPWAYSCPWLFFVSMQDDLKTRCEERTHRRRTLRMAGPLDGIRVVEISMFQQGPVAGMRLGDLGAHVIKIEAPSGDPARGFMKIIGAMAGLSGNNYYFEHNNRNKRGIALDLKSDKGMEIFLKLIDR